jgi:NADH-quinone oxidoreductase subunit M
MLGQVTNGKNLTLRDLNFREVAMFMPLIAWAIWIGVYPKPYFDILRKPVEQIVERVHPGYYAALPQAVPIGERASLGGGQ